MPEAALVVIVQTLQFKRLFSGEDEILCTIDFFFFLLDVKEKKQIMT